MCLLQKSLKGPVVGRPWSSAYLERKMREGGEVGRPEGPAEQPLAQEAAHSPLGPSSGLR